MPRGIRYILGNGLSGLMLAGGAISLWGATPPPATEEVKSTQIIHHPLTLGRLPAYRNAEYRGIFLPSSINFKPRTDYLNQQERLMLREIAILGGARVVSSVNDADNTLNTDVPHELKTGDKVELIASGPVPGGLKGRTSVEDPQVFYYVGSTTAQTLQLHLKEIDALNNTTPIDLSDPIEGNLRPDTVHLVTANLNRRRPPNMERQNVENPSWDSIFKRLKIILESDATSKIKAEARSVALLSLAQRAERDKEYAQAHALYNIFTTNHARAHSGTQPPVSLPQVLLRQADMYLADRRWDSAVKKYYNVQRSLLARPVAGETQWQWLNLLARKGIGDAFYNDRMPGHTPDVRQWALRAGAIELAEVHFTAANAAKQVYQHVMVSELPHGLKDGAQVRILPLGTTHRDLGVPPNSVFNIKVVTDNQFILLVDAEDIAAGKRRGVNIQLPSISLVMFLSINGSEKEDLSLQNLILASKTDTYEDEELVQFVYPRLVKLYAAINTYRRIRADIDQDKEKREIGRNFVGVREAALDTLREKLTTIEKNILNKLPILLKPDNVPLEPEVSLANLPPDDSWVIVFDHINDIIANNSVPVSAIKIDTDTDLLHKPRHGLKSGNAVRFSGPLPQTANVVDLDRSSIMYVRTDSVDTFSLHATASEAASNLSPVDFNGTPLIRTGLNEQKKIPFVTMVNIPYRESAMGVALVNLARKRQEGSDYSQAQQYLAEYRERYLESPLLPEVLLRQAHLFRLMGQPQMAIEKFYETMNGASRARTENLIKFRRIILMAQVRIADTYFANLSNYPEAIKLYRQLLKDPDEELVVENTRFKLIHVMMRHCFNLADDAADNAKLRENPSLPRERDTSLRELVFETTRFLVEHPRSDYRAQIRYLRAMAHEQLGDRRSADKDFYTLIETPAEEGEHTKWSFWKAKAGLDLANRLFDEGNHLVAAGLYQALLSQNRTLDTQIKIHQQIALCHGELKNPGEEFRAWQRINELWGYQRGRVKDMEDGLAILEKEAESLPKEEKHDHEVRIRKLKEKLEISHATLTPEIQLIVHMADSRSRMLKFREQINPKPAAADAVANAK